MRLLTLLLLLTSCEASEHESVGIVVDTFVEYGGSPTDRPRIRYYSDPIPYKEGFVAGVAHGCDLKVYAPEGVPLHKTSFAHEIAHCVWHASGWDELANYDHDSIVWWEVALPDSKLNLEAVGY